MEQIDAIYKDKEYKIQTLYSFPNKKIVIPETITKENLDLFIKFISPNYIRKCYSPHVLYDFMQLSLLSDSKLLEKITDGCILPILSKNSAIFFINQTLELKGSQHFQRLEPFFVKLIQFLYSMLPYLNKNDLLKLPLPVLEDICSFSSEFVTKDLIFAIKAAKKCQYFTKFLSIEENSGTSKEMFEFQITESFVQDYKLKSGKMFSIVSYILTDTQVKLNFVSENTFSKAKFKIFVNNFEKNDFDIDECAEKGTFFTGHYDFSGDFTVQIEVTEYSIYEVVLNHIVRNPMILEIEPLKNLSIDTMKRILKNQNLCVNSEDQVVDVVVRWNLESRPEKNLLELVKWSYVSTEKIVSVASKYKFLKDCVYFQQVFKREIFSRIQNMHILEEPRKSYRGISSKFQEPVDVMVKCLVNPSERKISFGKADSRRASLLNYSIKL